MDDKMNKDSIAFRLKMLRTEFGMKQADVAEKLKISQQTYSKYESQDIKIDSSIIIKLCELYGVTSDYILGIDTKPKPEGEKKLSSFDESDDKIDLIVDKVLSKIKNLE